MSGFAPSIHIMENCPYVGHSFTCEMRNDLLCNCEVKPIIVNAKFRGVGFKCPWWHDEWKKED